MNKQRCMIVVELGSIRYEMHQEFRCAKCPWHYTAEAPTGRSSCDSEESDSKHSPAETIRRPTTLPMKQLNKPKKKLEVSSLSCTSHAPEQKSETDTSSTLKAFKSEMHTY